MLNIDTADLVMQTAKYAEAAKKSSSAPLFFNDFIKKSLTLSCENVHPTYPMHIKLPKSLSKLLKGDTEPKEIISIEEPLYYNDTPVWFNNSAKGTFMRFGYLNGDSRYPCDLRLDDKDIHLLLAGATGHGKSVTLNTGVYSVAFEYAPWEVNITFCDAKIVEARKYVGDVTLPHVSSIGATEDADYIISVLDEKRREMMTLNKVFSAVGSSNIESYRKKTGLVIPQNLIVIDEVQIMFANAGKLAGTLTEIFNAFSKLGRSTGYHLILASQEFGSEIPQATLNQILVRAALGCQENVSEKILGNKAAAMNLGVKGKLIVNTNPAAHDQAMNKNYRVPFLTDDDFVIHREGLNKLGAQVGFTRQLSYFDEDSLLTESKMLDLCKQTANPNRIILGEPSFVMREEDGINYVKMLFSGKDIENVFIYGQNKKEVIRLVRTILKSIEAMGQNVSNLAAVIDYELKESIGMDLDSFKFVDIKSCDSSGWTSILVSLYIKKLALNTDSLVGDMLSSTSEIDEYFYSIFERNSEEDTLRNRVRVRHALNLLKQKDFEILMWESFNSRSKDQAYVDANIKSLIKYVTAQGFANKRLSKYDLPPVYIWIVGINKLLGVGRDVKITYQEHFKKILLDASDVNARFMVVATSTEELGSLKAAFKYYLLGRVQENQISRMGLADFYPNQIGENLCVLCSPTADKNQSAKFKRMILKEEEDS